MKNIFNKNDISIWIDLCWIYACGTLALLLKAKWYVWALLAVVTGSIALVKYRKAVTTNHSNIATLKRIKSALNTAKKTGDPVAIYNTLENNVLPELRENLPQRLFKYYSLSDNESNNECKLDSLKNNKIWSSVYSQFNDPFECQYMYMEAKDFEEIGFLPDAKPLWEKVMAELRRRITTICFTQNPNDMPMWAHYANTHKGFCVEYQVTDTTHLYPVMYVEKRLKAPALFVELFYELFNTDIPQSEKGIALKHVMLLSAFKDKSWKSENEVRAIFINSATKVSTKGRLCSYDEIGVRPCKIFIGAMCSEANIAKLVLIAQETDIEYEICHISYGESFGVI